MTYSCGMFFSSLCVNICTFPQKPNLTHAMQEQKCLFSGSLKQTDVSSICQQVMRKLLLLQDIITYALLLRRMLVFCRKDNSIPWVVFPIVWEILTRSQNCGLEGTFGDSLVQSRCSSRVNYSRLLWSMTSEVLIISKDGDSMHSLVNLLHCSTTLTLKKK